MLIRPFLLALVAACGVSNTATDPREQPIKPPDVDEPTEEQHFCCQSVDPEKRTGDDCVLAAKEQLAACNAAILYCPGFYTLDNGVVSCPK